MKREAKYAIMLTVLYLVMGLIGIWHHELWLDESHHWLLARDSNSFSELISNTRYEGHPILWNVLLYGITRFSWNPLGMQLLHIGIATAVTFVFVRKAPFSWLFKTLFIFGYFMIFEYCLISRNYMIGILFLFLACTAFKNRHKNFIVPCCWLAVAAQTHLIFMLIAFAFFVLLLLDFYIEKRAWQKTTVWGCLIFIGALALAIYQVIPPDDTRFFLRVDNIPLSEKFTKGFISFFKGLVALPDFGTIHFWNSNFAVKRSEAVAAVLGLLVYALPLILFYRNRRVLFFTYTALLGTQLFFFATQMSATRYDGMTYIIFLIALWLDAYTGNETSRWKSLKQRYYLDVLRNPIVYGILILQVGSGLFAWGTDFKYRFSGSESAFEYLKSNHLSDRTIISAGCEGTSISAYLQKKVWFLCNASPQSFCRWDSGCAQPIDQKNLGFLLDHFEASNQAVAVLSEPIPDIKPGVWVTLSPNTKIKFHTAFKNNVVRQSNYYIYEILKTDNPKP